MRTAVKHEDEEEVIFAQEANVTAGYWGHDDNVRFLREKDRKSNV